MILNLMVYVIFLRRNVTKSLSAGVIVLDTYLLKGTVYEPALPISRGVKQFQEVRLREKIPHAILILHQIMQIVE